MARVTVEDCIVQVPNRFELVMFAAQRARDISAGAQITLDRDRDKNPVVALREIAETKLDQAVLKDSLISGMQKHADIDKPDYGDAVPVGADEIPVFWACGVTPQSVIAAAKLPFAITHAPGLMLVTDLLNKQLAVL